MADKTSSNVDGLSFVILSFEGPDGYSRAGGLGSRVTELSEALAEMGFDTHLVFVGDPYLPGQETRCDGRLHLYRWCQWISAHHPGGVYDGEEGKLRDWNGSLPWWVTEHIIGTAVASGKRVAVLAEEWQTAESAVLLEAALKTTGIRSSTWLSWNANNTFSFDRVPWAALKAAVNITTVSRYMKQEMAEYGVDAYVTPNGISDYWLDPVDRESESMFQELFQGRLVLTKVARWDPDKRWHQAIDAIADLKRSGLHPLLLARGGSEPHGVEVLGRAAVQGLSVGQAAGYSESIPSLLDAFTESCQTDAIILREPLSADQRRLLFHTSDAVLANSGVEPFGLVGLETMASGGVAIVGATGEDYATPGYDCLAAQRGSAKDLPGQLRRMVEDPKVAQDIRRAAKTSAAQYTWAAVIKRCLLPAIAQDFGASSPSRASYAR